MKILFFFIFIFLNFFQSRLWAQTFSMGQYSIGQASINLDLSQFYVSSSQSQISYTFLKESLQWIRTEDNLLTPRALLKIKIPTSGTALVYSVMHDNQTVLLNHSKNEVSTEIYVNLFQPPRLLVFANEQQIDEPMVLSKQIKNAEQQKLLDHTCLPYQVEVSGLNDDYLSVGCKMHRVGPLGQEKPRLEVTLSSPNLITKYGQQPPFKLYFNKSTETETLFDNERTQRPVKLKVKTVLPEKMTRLKLAGGLGPYIFNSKYKTETYKNKTTLSLMLYSKFELSETTSLKAFDAIIYDKTLFNNAGLYFSYDLARVLDGRLLIGALLGFQGINYKFNADSTSEFDFIYPQGGELIYSQAFGTQQNLSLGGFFSTTADPYKNVWIRWGKAVFYELNYIEWEKLTSRIDMWGLSVGFPLMTAF